MGFSPILCYCNSGSNKWRITIRKTSVPQRLILASQVKNGFQTRFLLMPESKSGGVYWSRNTVLNVENRSKLIKDSTSKVGNLPPLSLSGHRTLPRCWVQRPLSVALVAPRWSHSLTYYFRWGFGRCSYAGRADSLHASSGAVRTYCRPSGTSSCNETWDGTFSVNNSGVFFQQKMSCFGEVRRSEKKKRSLKLWNAAEIRHSTQVWLDFGRDFKQFRTMIKSEDNHGQQMIKFIPGSKAWQIEQKRSAAGKELRV